MSVHDLDNGDTAYYTDHEPVDGLVIAGVLDAGLDRVENADIVVAHNALGYDIPLLEKLRPHRYDRSKVRDTLVMSRLLEPDMQDGHSIGAWGERLGTPKGDVTDFSKYDMKMRAYCMRDTDIAAKVYLATQEVETWGDALLGTEQPFAEIMGMQMRAGWQFDDEQAMRVSEEFKEKIDELRDALNTAFPPRYAFVEEFTPKRPNKTRGYVAGAPITKIELQTFNPGSRQQIAARLISKYNWTPHEFTESGQVKVDEEIIGALPFPEAKLLAEYLETNKLYSMVAGEKKADGSGGGWLSHLDYDTGRIYGYINSCGAVTGRCTHSKPNLAQTPTVAALRACFVAKPGHVLFGCDADSLELRMLGHYLATWDGGAYSNVVDAGLKEHGTDAHTLTKKLVGLFSRNNAKTLIYACLYGAGDAKAGETVLFDAREAGKPVPFGAAHTIGRNAKNRLISGIKGFTQLKELISLRIQQTMEAAPYHPYLIGLDGRKLWIRSEHSALNTLLQSAGALVMKRAVIIFVETARRDIGYEFFRDYVLVGNIHDEVQGEAHPHLAGNLGGLMAESIRTAGEQFKMKCPLKGNYSVGNNWSETH